MRTIIFLSGLAVPVIVAKSKYIWEDNLWKYYNRIYITSKIPTSDLMVERELDRLCNLFSKYDKPIIVGQSLGAWWAANLGSDINFTGDKLVFWTPLVKTSHYGIFNVTERFNPLLKPILPKNKGPHKSIVFEGKKDWLVPWQWHSQPLAHHYEAVTYPLDGGHWYQTNHKEGLIFLKEWIEVAQ